MKNDLIIESKDVSLSAKGNVRLEAGENTSVTTTENKFSSASIGASFTPQGLSNISVNASKGNGNSKETLTAYSPALVVAENTLSLTSGGDMDIIGSKAQGDKITAKVGGNLNIETLQEKETYEEQNKSAGFGVSWSMNPVTQHLSKPTFGRDWSKGTIDSDYRSARDQAGFFAGSKGFDIYVKKNTDLKGGLIASEASSDKNKLSTGTFSFSDLHNEAEYSAKDTGSSAQIKPTLVQTKKEDPEGNKEKTLKVVQALHSTPSIPTVVQGSADSTTKAAVAPGTINIRENPTQDISALSRDTANALNELGRIFDKKSVEEQKELVNVFREEAFNLLHDLPDDGSGRKVFLHALVGGLISQFSGAGFASGAAGAGLNEALINNLKGLDPTIAQIASGVLGAAAAKAINGNATAGAISAASGTKYNALYEEMIQQIISKEDLPYLIEQATKEGKIPFWETMKDDYYFFDLGATFPFGRFLEGTLGGIIDRKGNLYLVLGGGAAFGVSTPLQITGGFGNLLSRPEEDTAEKYKDAIMGLALSSSGAFGIQAAYGRSLTGDIDSAEISVTTAAGAEVAIKRIIHMGRL